MHLCQTCLWTSTCIIYDSLTPPVRRCRDDKMKPLCGFINEWMQLHLAHEPDGQAAHGG